MRELPLSRRQVLKAGAAAVPCLLGSVAVFNLLDRVMAASPDNIEPIVASYDPAQHRWGFVVDAGRCIGCLACMVACKQENNVPLGDDTNRTWVERHTVAADGTVTIETAHVGRFEPVASQDVASGSTTQFVPRLCMQCENPPCVSVCPVSATFRTTDGVILVDEGRCIGCGYCVMACPYGARYLVPAGERTPAGVAGVADKCTFCYHRIIRGQVPACVEICPVDARQFGDLNDPSSDVSVVLREQDTRVIKPELGTQPRVYYVGLEGEVL
jgi:tetrathionate reductase subunit B